MVLFPAIAVFMTLPVMVQAQDTPAFDKLKSSFENRQVYVAAFSHEYNDAFTGESQRSEGHIWIGKDQYKIEGDTQRMLVDGEVSRVYDSTKNRVIVSDYIEEEDDFAPSRMLQGADETFLVSEGPADNGETLISLHSDDPFAVFQDVQIYLNSNGIPLRIEATDQVDNRLITRFESGRFIDEEEDLFDIKLPDGVEIIDLRYDAR